MTHLRDSNRRKQLAGLAAIAAAGLLASCATILGPREVVRLQRGDQFQMVGVGLRAAIGAVTLDATL